MKILKPLLCIRKCLFYVIVNQLTVLNCFPLSTVQLLVIRDGLDTYSYVHTV